MPYPKTRTTLIALTVLAIACALAPADALAAAGGNAIGQNLGGLLSSWARSFFGGVIAIISVVFLISRRYSDLGLFVGAAVVVGGLIFSTPTVVNVIRAIWTTLGA